MTWTAPSTNVGSVTFYAAGLSANNNFGTSGDKCYATTGTTTALDTVSYVLSTTAPTCAGDSDGVAIIDSISGGTGGPYSVSWGAGISSSGDTATGLASGNYTVTISDGSGNSESRTFSIATGNSPVLATGSSTTICADSTGSAWTGVSAGTLPYTFNWSSGGTTDTIGNLLEGSYYVTVTDANSCVVSDSATVGRSGSNIIVSISTTDEYCGNQNGTATADSVSGAIGNVSYVWQTGSTTSSDMNIRAGNYLVTVTDTLGCTEVTPYTVGGSTTNLAASLTTGPDNCQAGVGYAAVSGLTGGLGAIQYSWSTGSTADSIGGLLAGPVSVTITDSVGCSVVLTDTVIDSQSPTLTFDVTDLRCFGDSSGQFIAQVRGGQGPYSLDWPGGTTSDTVFSNLPAGNYSVTATDSNGCVVTQTATIAQPDELVSDSIVSTSSGTITCVGTAEIFPSGGTGAYLYEWDDSLSTNTALLSNVCPGVYTVTVTDDNLCELVDSVEVEFVIPTGIEIPATPAITLSQFGNTLEIESGEILDISIVNQLGQEVMKVKRTSSTEIDLSALPFGIYWVGATSATSSSSLRFYKH